jgi:hypothetical protein
VAWSLLCLALFSWFLWAAGSLWFSNLRSAEVRGLLTAAYVVVIAVVLVRVRPFERAVVIAVACTGVVTLAYALVRPSNDREWQKDVSVAPTIDIEGDRVTVRGVRDFRWRSDTDFDARWEDRTYDLSKLRSFDLFMSYWGPVDWCHTIVSFGFEGGEQLAVSVETRKEVGEGYSTLAGIYKRFELVYVFADERDVIGVRTNCRGENVQLYHVRAPPDRLREVFLSYARFADDLARSPQFYKVFRNSCGVNILHRVAETGHVELVGRDALLNGHWDSNLYKKGAIDTSLPFEELRALSRIDERAKAAGDSPDFSRAIRVGLPGPPR